MTLQERLMADLNDALRRRDASRASALRMLRNAIQYEEKARGKPLEEAGVLEVVAREVKQRRESIEAFEAGHRQDLADKERAELAFLQPYLPDQLSQDEVVEIIRSVIAETGATGPRDKGRVMGRLMPQIRGKADGNVANQLVNQVLEQLGS